MNCPKCGETFFRSYTFAVHKSKCIGTPRPVVSCPRCNTLFNSKSTMYHHKRRCDLDSSRQLFTKLPSQKLVSPKMQIKSNVNLSEVVTHIRIAPVASIASPRIQAKNSDNIQKGKELWENLQDSRGLEKYYFIYGLIDPRLNGEDGIFYIGKGTNNRPHDHLMEALDKSEEFEYQTICKSSKETKNECDDIAKIWSIWESGYGVGIVQCFLNITKTEATAMEACLVDELKRQLTYMRRVNVPATAHSWDLWDMHAIARYGLNEISTSETKYVYLDDLDIEAIRF